MNLFVLDDNKGRHKGFGMMFEQHHVVSAWTFYDAVGLVWAHKAFDVVFLDHDLDESPVPNPAGAPGWPMSGLDMANWMATLPESKRPRRVVIHSSNKEAIKLMTAVLQKAGYPDIRTIDFLDLFRNHAPALEGL